jgi:hypothetical protein
MTDGTFVKEMKDAIQQPMQFGDVILHPAGWERAKPPKPNEPAPLAFSTLGAIRDYLAVNVDANRLDEMMIHVQSPTSIALLNRIEEIEPHFRRMVMANASALGSVSNGAYGQYQDSETFTIWLMTNFVHSDDRARLLALIASIKDSGSLTVSDDGMSQSVATQRGAVFTNRETVNNPFMLAPFRTFREVEQPESPFVLRMRRVEGEAPKLALFECDGGAWQIAAIANVSAWLKDQTKGVSVIA